MQSSAPQRRADAGRDGLLTDRDVDEAVDVAVAEVAPDPLLEGADAAHLAEPLEQAVGSGATAASAIMGF